MPIHALGTHGVMTEVALSCGDVANEAVCDPMVMRGQKRLKQALAKRPKALRGLSFHDANFWVNWGLHDGTAKLLDYGQ
jgi:hypothetical protein